MAITSNNKNKENIITLRYIIFLALCVLVTALVSIYVIGMALVCGPSMRPTMESGDIVVVNKLSSKFNRFDIVIIDWQNEMIVKRVIGSPGDTVRIFDGSVFVNGEPINDVVECSTEYAGIAVDELTLGEGEYFVLGDNRIESKDSRYEDVGVIQEKQIVGTVLFSLIPFRIFSQ